jgi:integrase
MDNSNREIAEQVHAYVSFRRAEGLKPSTLDDARYRILAIARDCGFNRLQDATPEMITRWFTDSAIIDDETGKARRSARTRKLNLTVLAGFFEWAVRLGFISDNPCKNAPRPVKYKHDRRKFRRALSSKELETLCYVTRFRPLAEYAIQRVPNFMRKTVAPETITLSNVERLACEALEMRHTEQLFDRARNGIKWDLIYRVLGFTGLRWNELRSLRLRHLEFGAEPRIHLSGEFTKNGCFDSLPLNSDIAKRIEAWVIDNKVKPNDLLIDQIPEYGVKRLNRDLRVAGIPKVDNRGRSVDIHSLRYSFATSLALRNVSPRVAQKLMRHSSLELTLGVYTDFEMFDEFAAVNSLSFEPVKPAKAKPSEPPAATDWQAMIATRLMETATPEQLADLLKTSAK